MKLWNKLLRRESTGGVVGGSVSSGTGAQSQPSGGDYVGRAVIIKRGEEALVVSAVYSAVEIVSNTLAMMSIKYQRRDRKGGCYVDDDGRYGGQRLNYLLQIQPNERQNAMQFWREVWQSVVLRGNAIVWLERGADGEPLFFDTAHRSATVLYDKQRNRYEVTDMSLGVYKELEGREVIHLRNTYTDMSGLWGISTIAYASRALSVSATADAQTLDTTSKGGRMKFIIMQPPKQSLGVGRYSFKENSAVAEKLNDEIYSQDVSFLNTDGELKQVSLSAADQQLLQNRQFGVPEVARFFGVPKSMLMDDSNSSYKTPSAAQTAFLNRTLAPRMRELELELNAKLLGMSGYGPNKLHVCERNIFVLDLESQAAWNKSRLETGVATVNELRKEQNMPKVENGDDVMVSTNLAIAGSEKLSGATSGNGNSGGADGNGDGNSSGSGGNGDGNSDNKTDGDGNSND